MKGRFYLPGKSGEKSEILGVKYRKRRKASFPGR